MYDAGIKGVVKVGAVVSGMVMMPSVFVVAMVLRSASETSRIDVVSSICPAGVVGETAKINFANSPELKPVGIGFNTVGSIIVRRIVLVAVALVT